MFSAHVSLTALHWAQAFLPCPSLTEPQGRRVRREEGEAGLRSWSRQLGLLRKEVPHTDPSLGRRDILQGRSPPQRGPRRPCHVGRDIQYES